MLDFDSLEPKEREFLLRQSFCENQAEFDIYSNMVSTLFQWGVMCFHPPELRTTKAERWYYCGACKCDVIEPCVKVRESTG